MKTHYPLARAVALSALLLIGSSLYAHQDHFPAGSAIKSGEVATERREAREWLDLFLEIVYAAPSTEQERTIRTAWALYDGWLAKTQEPPANLRRKLLQDCREQYDRLRSLHPHARITLGKDSCKLAPRAPIELTSGLESFILLEVENHSGKELITSAGMAGSTPGRSLKLPEHGAGVLWIKAKPPLKDGNVVVRMSHEGVAGGNSCIDLPVRVVEPARLRVRVIEPGEKAPFPARLYVQAADGLFRRDTRYGAIDTLSTKPLLNFVFAGHAASSTLPFFYTDGSSDILLPPGKTVVTVERGFEHFLKSTNLVLKPGETRKLDLTSERLVDMRAQGWVSGDTHIHWSKNSWDVDEDIDLLSMVQRAEDLRVANNLTLKHYTTNQNFVAPTQFPMGPVPGRCSADWHIQMAEEYRNQELYGHLIFLNIKRLIEPISTGFMGGPPFHNYPPNLPAILDARAQGGINIEAHGLGANHDVPVNVSQDLTDSLDQIEADDYYRFLDCGFQLPLSNGSDHPARVAGCARVYVKTPAPFSYEGWINGIRSNRTFTTSGPLLLVEVNGREIGDVIEATADTPLRIRATAMSRFSLGTVQIVSNGKVLAEKKTAESQAVLETEIPAAEPRWIVARCSQNAQFAPLSGPETNPNAAHTSAIYVKVGGRSRFVSAAAEEWIRRMTIHAEEVSRSELFANQAQKDEALEHVKAGVEAYKQLLTSQGTSFVQRDSELFLIPVKVDKPVHRRPGMAEGQDLSRVAFLIQVPWVSAPMELRFPEVIRSSAGFHFLDNYASSITPLAEWDIFPEWKREPRTGALRYDFSTPDGLRLIGSATPNGDEIALEYTVVNNRPEAISNVEANCCLAFNNVPELDGKWDPSIIFAVLDGKWTSFDKATPTAKEIGREPWFLSLREDAKKTTDLPRVSPTWWMIDQHHTENLMGAVTLDRKWLVGYTWSVEPIGLMSNGGNPCLHTGMGYSPFIAPGKSYTWRGKIYLLPNNPEELMKRYHKDQVTWQKTVSLVK